MRSVAKFVRQTGQQRGIDLSMPLAWVGYSQGAWGRGRKGAINSALSLLMHTCAVLCVAGALEEVFEDALVLCPHWEVSHCILLLT